MERLIAEQAALQQCFRFHQAQDTLDTAQFHTLVQPAAKITLDLSRHLPHIGVSEVTPEQCWAAIVQGLAGFTATHHQLGNCILESNDALDRVSVVSKVTAFHCIEEAGGVVQSSTGRVNQTMELEKWEGRWVIRKLVLQRDVPLDNAWLYVVAVQRVEEGKGRKPQGDKDE